MSVEAIGKRVIRRLIELVVAIAVIGFVVSRAGHEGRSALFPRFRRDLVFLPVGAKKMAVTMSRSVLTNYNRLQRSRSACGSRGSRWQDLGGGSRTLCG